jgi:hypothetical protein
MNFYESYLREHLSAEMASNRIIEVLDSSIFFKQLSTVYPIVGSKIAWSAISGSIESYEEDISIQKNEFISFFRKIRDRFSLSGEAIYMGESATDFALLGDIQVFDEIISKILDVPQHHYFVSKDFSWCMSFTMEGDMAFGFRGKACNAD